MKLELKLTNNWLEATWIEDDIQVHCEYFSGHPEHISMLRNKAKEYGTELDESIVKELIDSYVAPTQEELDANELANKIQEAKAYLLATDYKCTVDYFGSLSEDKQKELIDTREVARQYIRANEGVTNE